MKKKIVLLTILSALTLGACTNETPKTPDPAPAAAQTVTDTAQQDGGSTADTGKALLPADIYAKISSAVTLPDLYLGDDDWILNNYGLEADKLEGYVCAEGDELHADRIFIIKTKDQAYVAEVEDKLNAILSQLTSPEMLDYMPEQAAFMKAGRVVSSGNYVYLLISAEADDIETIIKDNI